MVFEQSNFKPTLELVFKCDICSQNVIVVTSETHMNIVESIRHDWKGNDVFYNMYHKECEAKK